MAVRREDLEPLAEKLLEGLGLRGRLDDDDGLGHMGRGRSHIKLEIANSVMTQVRNIRLFPGRRPRAVSVKQQRSFVPASCLPPHRLPTPYLPPSTASARPAASSSKSPASTVAAGRSSAIASCSAESSSRASSSSMRRASGESSTAATGDGPGGRGCPTDGKSSVRTSSAPRHRIAPSFRSACAPSEVGGEDRAGHGEHVAAEVGGEPRRDERARPSRGLDDHDPRRQARDDAIADRKILRARLGPRRVLGDEQLIRRHPFLETAVLARIVDVDAAAEDRDRAARRFQGGFVGRRVHAAREARHDGHARACDLAREPPRHVPAVTRGVAGAHDRDGRQAEPFEAAEREDEKRRVGDLGEPERKFGIEGRHQAHPRGLDTGGPAIGLRVVARPQHRPRPLPGAQKSGQVLLFGGQDSLDASARAQDRPQPLRGHGSACPRNRGAAGQGGGW